MSTPPVPPLSEFDVKPSPLVNPEFGPNPDRASTEEAKPNAEKKARAFKLGSNKKVRSGVRKLTAQDREKIESLYVTAGMVAMPFKPKTAQALATCAEDCAKAWYDLAEENDSVRRTILMLIEGGAWGAVFAAHIPLFMTLIPEGAFPFPMNFGEMEMPDNDA